MKLLEWKKKNNYEKRYAHFDKRVRLSEVWDYITKPSKIAVHGFYPLIYYKKQFNKYSHGEIKQKSRDLCYSAHIDRCIYQYYGYLLNQEYNKKAENDRINDVAIAYRDNLKQNNIHFAKKAIDCIRQLNDCYIIVGDFTNFFDNLDHKYLKRMLCNVLECRSLPADYYAVYKNITRFSTWDLSSLLRLNNLEDNKPGHDALNSLGIVLAQEKFKANKKSCIKPHKNAFGIPQGSAISAVLSNIYLIDFDKTINEYVKQKFGLYMRYSDDFIIILPGSTTEAFQADYNSIREYINEVPRLELQTEKTQIFRFYDRQITSCNEFGDRIPNGKNILNYLGFSFDGKTVTIRDKTLTKYYYRMYRKIKTIKNYKGYSKHGKKISCKKLYLVYSRKGAHKDRGNFLTYVEHAEKVFGTNESITRGTNKHMQKIRKRLNAIYKEK